MKPRAVVVDTNVLVAGLLTGNDDAPTARIVAGMIEGGFPFLLSTPLVAEYGRVLLRPKIRALHGLSDREVDAVLTEIVVNAVVREPEASPQRAPEPDDRHLWDLLSAEAGVVLVTGDRELLRQPPRGRSVVSPAAFWEATAS